MFRRQISEKIIPTISMAWYFTTKSGGICFFPTGCECRFSLLKPYLRVFRGISKCNLPGYVGFFQFLRNLRQHNACEQAERILYAALDLSIARRARKGEFVQCLDHFDLLQTAIN
jgi:hypothetical protein